MLSISQYGGCMCSECVPADESVRAGYEEAGGDYPVSQAILFDEASCDDCGASDVGREGLCLECQALSCTEPGCGSRWEYQASGAGYCEDHALDRGIVGECEGCGHVVAIATMSTVLGRLCDDVRVCEICSIVCESCDSCSESVLARAARWHAGIPYCVYCYDEETFECAGCLGRYHADDAHCDSYENPLCEDCHGSASAGALEDAGYTPRFDFHRTPECILRGDDRYYGVEWEVEQKYPGDDSGPAIVAESGLPVFCKEDGSLTDGMEVVSHPMTWRWVEKNADKIRTMFDALSYEGWDSQDRYGDETTGNHVHVSRTSLSSETMLNLQILVAVDEDWTAAFAGRDVPKLRKWADVRGDETEFLCNIDGGQAGRYRGWNFEPSKTVECRLFAGTSCGREALRNIEAVRAMIEYAESHAKELMVPEKFEAYVLDSKARYPRVAAKMAS